MNLFQTIQSHIKSFEKDLYVTIPCKVLAYDPLESTVNVQILVLKQQRDGTYLKEPILERVPIQFPCVNDCAITFPIKVGDKGILHFCHDNIENIFIQPEEDKEFYSPRTNSKHDVNDCFFTVGLRRYDETPVKRDATFDLYFGDSRLTMSEDGKVELQLVKTDGDEENPQVLHTQTLTMLPTGDTSLVYNKDDIDSQVNILATGEINLLNNKESSSVKIEADGNISGVTKSKFSMQNPTGELVDWLSQLADLVSQITTNTVYGISPINNKAAVQALKSQIDSMKV